MNWHTANNRRKSKLKREQQRFSKERVERLNRFRNTKWLIPFPALDISARLKDCANAFGAAVSNIKFPPSLTSVYKEKRVTDKSISNEQATILMARMLGDDMYTLKSNDGSYEHVYKRPDPDFPSHIPNNED